MFAGQRTSTTERAAMKWLRRYVDEEAPTLKEFAKE